MAPNSERGFGWKQAVLVVVGMLISIVFLYLAFRGISWPDLLKEVKQMHPVYLLPCLIIMLLVQLVRALRFGLILSPFCKLSIRDLWDMLNLWAGATMVMPARLGELVRPYLLRRSGASFSSGIGAVMVERFFDLSGLLLLLGVVLWKTPEVPPEFMLLGQVLLVLLILGYVIVWLILTRRERFRQTVEKLTSWLPTRAGFFIQDIVLRITDGFGIMTSVKQVLVIGFYSLCIWILFSLLTYLFLLAFSVKAPFLVAVTIHVFICFGVALPSAPGFIGTFHAAARLALELFGINPVVAISFATVYHLFSLIVCILLGIISLLTGRFRLQQVLEPEVNGESTDNPDEFLRSGECQPRDERPCMGLPAVTNGASTVKDWVELDRKYIWHPFTQMSEWQSLQPLIIEQAEGNYLIDTEGRRYLDGISSLWVNLHGHRRGEIDEAVTRQLSKVSHTTLLGLASVPSIELAEKLVQIAPEGLNKVFYSDSGSTAVEVALKIAFQYWRNLGHEKRKLFVTLSEAYHGDTIGSVSLGGIDLFHQIFHPLLFQTLSIQTPFPYRFPDLSPESCRENSLDEFRSLAQKRADEIAALVVEPIVQGAAGMIVHPQGFLKGLEKICREYGILLICDEVATGFGRTGKMFACEHEGVRPDIMTLAKGLSGGYLPIAATMVTDDIHAAFLGEYTEYKTFFHGHSYTGNCLACAAACACLEIFENNRVLEASQSKIALLKERLSEEIGTLGHVGDVRQCGFMIGIELVEDRSSRKAYPVEKRVGAQVCQHVRNYGLILRPLGDVVVLMPPLSITPDEILNLVSITARSIREICGE